MEDYGPGQTGNATLTISVRRAAEMLGISEYLARQMVKHGELPTMRFGRLVRVPRARLMALVNGKPNDA